MMVIKGVGDERGRLKNNQRTRIKDSHGGGDDVGCLFRFFYILLKDRNGRDRALYAEE